MITSPLPSPTPVLSPPAPRAKQGMAAVTTSWLFICFVASEDEVVGQRATTSSQRDTNTPPQSLGTSDTCTDKPANPPTPTPTHFKWCNLNTSLSGMSLRFVSFTRVWGRNHGALCRQFFSVFFWFFF